MYLPVLPAGEDHRSACLCWSTTSGWCCGVSPASSASTAQNWKGRTDRERVNSSIIQSSSHNWLMLWPLRELIGTLQVQYKYKPVVTNGCKPSNVQHQRGVQWAWLGRLALWWRRAFMTQHAGASHPPQLGALPWLLHKNYNSCIFSYFYLNHPFYHKIYFLIINSFVSL